jgi:arylsulfatase A-like enzyme
MVQLLECRKKVVSGKMRIVLALMVCALSSSLFGQTQKDRRPNIVFFIADDMQRYMFNCLEEVEPPYLTPNLDRMAAEGTLMEQQYVSAPVCTPSRFSCLTGRYASRSISPRLVETIERDGQSIIGWNTMIRPGQVTLASLLRQAGYKTGMVGKNHVIEAPGRKKVEYREDPTDPTVHARLQADQQLVCEAIKQCGFDYAGAIYHNNPDGNGPRALAVHNLDWIASAAMEFVDQYRDHPFFLYLAVTVPHGPGDAKRSWNADRRATAAGLLDEPLAILPPTQTIPERLNQAGLPVDDQRANMLWLDDTIGLLLDKLREHNLEDNTIVFFFNDHGQGAKGTLYQGGVSNPSIVWRKGGFPCGPISRVRVSNIDFAPTILDLTGTAQPEDLFDGVSFRAALQGRDDPIHGSLYFEMGFTRAVIKGNWKYLALRYPQRATGMLIEERTRALERFNNKQNEHGKRILTTDPTAPFSHISLIPGGAGAEAASTGKRPGYYDADQLYDLSHDPGELKNLADDPQYADVLEDMRSELRKYLDDLPGGFAELKPNH